MDTASIENQVIDWCRELGLSIDSPNDDIFACGATSLTAIRLMNQIDNLYGEDTLDAHDLYRCTSITQIAQTIHTNLPESLTG